MNVVIEKAAEAVIITAALKCLLAQSTVVYLMTPDHPAARDVIATASILLERFHNALVEDTARNEKGIEAESP